MACEDIELATTLAKTIKGIDKESNIFSSNWIKNGRSSKKIRYENCL